MAHWLQGRCLLEPYTDRTNHSGFLLNTVAHYDSMTQLIAENGFQACTHAIGDLANRENFKSLYQKFER